VSEELTPEDRAGLAALVEALGTREAEPGAVAMPAPAAEEETLGRLYHEALGLIAYALPPTPPPPAARLRLMAALVAPAPTSAPAPSLARPARHSRSSSPSSPSSPSRWPLSLAAALILALLGVCGWLYRGLAEKGDAIAHLAAERNSALQHAGEVEARLRQLNTQVSSLRAGVAMVTSPAVEVCTLRAVTQAGAPDAKVSDARGMLFVAADHQHWYMSVRGLRPAGDGRVYQLWFVADQGMVSGGTFAANREDSSELSSEHMPAGTRGVKITLENSPGAPAPNGPDVLRNADSLHSI
jgi:hypothetical protein